MNNLKFRHYDTRLNEMRYSDKHDGEFYINTKGVLYMYAIPKSESGLETKYYQSYKVEQFSGVLDVNGKEVYEGDIVYLAGYGNHLVTRPFLQLYESLHNKDVGGILGNIYENKDIEGDF